MGAIFGSTTKTKQATQSQQSGTSQSNLADDPRFQGGLSNFFQQFSGPSVAGVTTAPNAYQISAADYMLGALAPGSTVGQIAATGLTPGMISSAMSPYISAVVDPTIAAFGQMNRQALSNLRGSMGARGSLGNNTGAEAAYLAGVQPQQQAQVAQLYNQGFGQATQTALQSLAQRMGAAGQQQQGAGALAGVGEMIRQAGLQGSMLPFHLTTQMGQSLAPWLQAAGVNFSGQSTGSSQGTSQTSPGIGNVIAGLLGAAMQFSDPDLKEGMREIGRTHDGQPLYVFNYKPGLGLPTHTQIGLSADDVAARDPGAVMETPLGAAVNYDRALAPAAGAAPMRDGGDVMMDKVARAYNMIRGMRRDALRDGGVADDDGRPGYFLGGLTSALGSLFPQTTSLGTSPGGWETSVMKPGLFGSDAAKGAGKALSSGLGDLQGDPKAGADIARAGSDALGREQASLSSMLQGLINPRGDGGRVGYEDGGEADVNLPQWGEGFESSYVAPRERLGPTVSNAGPDDLRMPPLSELVMMGPGGHRAPGITTVTRSAAPAPAPPARTTEPRVHGGLDLSGYSDTPPTRAAVEAPPAAAAAAPNSWAPGTTTVREARPPAPMGWGERVGRFLFPSFYGEGVYHGRQATPLQRAGIGLMAMSGPMVAGPWAQAMMQQQEVDIRDREAARQSAALENQIRHQADVLAETVRHNRAAEDHPAVRALLAAGFQRGTPEFQRQLIAILDKDRSESAFSVATAQASAKQAQTLGEQIVADQAQLGRLDQLEKLLATTGVPSGPLANWELGARQLVASIFPGRGIEGLGEAEAARAITSAMALSERGQGMPGAMSDRDIVFLQSMVPQLTNTPNGNALLIRNMRDVAYYRRAVNTEAIRYINERRSNSGLQEHMTAWMAGHTMADVVPGHAQNRREIEAAAAAAPPPPPPAASEPPPAAVEILRGARGTPDEARHIELFNRRFNGGQPGLAERLLNPPVGSLRPVQG